MACVFLFLVFFNAVMYKNVHLRIALFGHETTWLYVCIVGEILILLLLGFLSVNSYTLYTLEEESQQKAAEEEWMHQLEIERVKNLLKEYERDLCNIDIDEGTKTVLNGMYKLVCQMYPFVDDTYSRLKSVENTVENISRKIPAGAFVHLKETNEIVSSIQTISSKVLANIVELETKVSKGRIVNNFGIGNPDFVCADEQIGSLRGLVANMDSIKNDFMRAVSALRNSPTTSHLSQDRSEHYLLLEKKIDSINDRLSQIQETESLLRRHVIKSEKYREKQQEFMNGARTRLTEIASIHTKVSKLIESLDNVIVGIKELSSRSEQMATVKSDTEDIRKLLTDVDKCDKDIKAELSIIRKSRGYEGLDLKLFKGQLDQLLGRTEILDTVRVVIHKYAFLLENSKGDFLEFLKVDDLLSQPVSVLKLGKEITGPLVRNGLVRIEDLLMTRSETIMERTKLGPKRMQRLEEALKAYSPGLRFGMIPM